MKRVFISQSMNGKTLEEIKAEREKLKEEAKRLMPYDELDFLNNIIPLKPPAYIAKKDLRYLSLSLLIMSKADVVFFAKGWEFYRTGRVERQCALAYDLDVLDVR